MTRLVPKERKPIALHFTDTGQEDSQLPGPSERSPKQMITALEDGKCVLLIPHIDTQRQVQGRGDDSVRILLMKSNANDMAVDAQDWKACLGQEMVHSPPIWM